MQTETLWYYNVACSKIPLMEFAAFSSLITTSYFFVVKIVGVNINRRGIQKCEVIGIVVIEFVGEYVRPGMPLRFPS